MEPIQLYALASRQAEWLAVRQKVVAGNVANANTPGFRAGDVEPFSAVLDKQTLTMTRTDAQHMDVAGSALESGAMRPAQTDEITHSGNDVNLEDELRKGGEVVREMSLNTAIIKSFHRMMMSTTRGNQG